MKQDSERAVLREKINRIAQGAPLSELMALLDYAATLEIQRNQEVAEAPRLKDHP